MFDAAPVQALAAAVTIGLILPLHSDVTARAEIKGAFFTEGTLIENVLSDMHGSAVG